MRNKFPVKPVQVAGGIHTVADVMVGDRFIHKTRLPYRDGDVSGVHHIVAVVEVTKVEGLQAEYKVVEVVMESGKPSFAGDAMNSGGGFSLLYINQSKTLERYFGHLPSCLCTDCQYLNIADAVQICEELERDNADPEGRRILDNAVTYLQEVEL